MCTQGETHHTHILQTLYIFAYITNIHLYLHTVIYYVRIYSDQHLLTAYCVTDSTLDKLCNK